MTQHSTYHRRPTDDEINKTKKNADELPRKRVLTSRKVVTSHFSVNGKGKWLANSSLLASPSTPSPASAGSQHHCHASNRQLSFCFSRTGVGFSKLCWLMADTG
jgi:hypothetical protein